METLLPVAEAAPYRDRKRDAWLLSLPAPALIGTGPLLYYATGDVRVLRVPAFFNYLLVPVLDLLTGRERSNLFSSHDFPWHAQPAGAIFTGTIGGYDINLGHELGHKRPAIERDPARRVRLMRRDSLAAGQNAARS